MFLYVYFLEEVFSLFLFNPAIVLVTCVHTERPFHPEPSTKRIAQMKNCCKSLRIKERQLRNKRRTPRKPQPYVWFKFDPDDSRQLILSNGTRLRQAYDGVGLFLSQGGNVYALSQVGLRNRRINFWKKNTYCKRLHTGRGRSQGQCYPYVHFHGHSYRLHQLMACAWLGGIPDGMVPDHINGDIDDFSTANLRIISVEENDRCGGILRRLRNASVKYGLPELNPLHMRREELLNRFEQYQELSSKQITKEIRMEAECLLAKRQK